MATDCNRSTPPVDPAPSQLLALPIELRLQIYEQLFRRSGWSAQQELVIYQGRISDSKFTDWSKSSVDPVPLLCTCREVYDELRPAIFRKAHYTIDFGRKTCHWDCEYHLSHAYNFADYTGFRLLRYVSIRVSFEHEHDRTLEDIASFVQATKQGEDIIRTRFDTQIFARIDQSRFDSVLSLLRQLRPRQPFLASISSSSEDFFGLDLTNYHRMIAESEG